MELYIPIILGTAREGRHSEKVAKFILEETKNAGLAAELIDVRDYRIPATDNTGESPTAKKIVEKIARADGYIVVSPEYNHGYPGELKMMLDMFYEEYNRKPIGFCGAGGMMGGGRMVEQMRLIAIELQMVPIREALYFPMVRNLFDEKGNLKDAAAYAPRMKAFLDELIWYARALKAGREAVVL